MRHILIGSYCLLVIVLLPNLIQADIWKETYFQETVWVCALSIDPEVWHAGDSDLFARLLGMSVNITMSEFQ